MKKEDMTKLLEELEEQKKKKSKKVFIMGEGYSFEFDLLKTSSEMGTHHLVIYDDENQLKYWFPFANMKYLVVSYEKGEE